MSDVQIFFSFHRTKLNARLCRLFTGCYAYHAGFVHPASDRLYDMHLIRRRRIWSAYAATRTVELYPCPSPVTREYLEDQLDTNTSRYGFRDYVRFVIRPLYLLLGVSAPNSGGVICSEMVNDDLRAAGLETPWKSEDAPPSPCDLRRWLLTFGRAG